MKSKVCVRCSNAIPARDAEGKEVCPICCSYEFREVEIQKEVKCCYCNSVYKGGYESGPPFYNAETNTFYCGCRGWD